MREGNYVSISTHNSIVSLTLSMSSLVVSPVIVSCPLQWKNYNRSQKFVCASLEVIHSVFAFVNIEEPVLGCLVILTSFSVIQLQINKLGVQSLICS